MLAEILSLDFRFIGVHYTLQFGVLSTLFVVTAVFYAVVPWVTFGSLIQGLRWVLYCGLLSFVVIAVLAPFAEGFRNHVDPAIISVSWMVWHGEPLYHAFDAPIISMPIYGPFLYLFHGAYFAFLNFLIGAENIGVPLMKLPGSAAALLGMFCLFAACRPGMRVRDALVLTALVATVFLIVARTLLSPRGDSLLLLFVAAALLAFVRIENVAVKAILIGAIGGVAANVKIFAPIYFLPIALLMWCRHGSKGILLPIFPAALVFAAPYFSAKFDFAIYLQHILSPKHGIDYVWFAFTLGRGIFLMIPFVAVVVAFRHKFGDARREILLYSTALVVTGVVVARTGGIPGGGSHHYIPLLPLIAYGFVLVGNAVNARSGGRAQMLIFFRWGRLASALVGVFMLLSLLGVAAAQFQTVNFLATQFKTGVVADIREALQEVGGDNVHMGYGATDEGYQLTFYRPVLLFAGHGYFLDPVALMDLQWNGIPISSAVRERVASCEFGHWLIPRGEEPFAMRSIFHPRVPLFDRQFRHLFRATYRKSGSSRFYDIWSCQDRFRAH